jgi:hyperosmotically inducible protein
MPALSAQRATVKKPQAEEKYPTTLTREIQHQILMLPFYSVFDSITFRIDGNKVTLHGQVVRHTLKDHAEAAVKSLEGVNSVVNEIEVLPVSPADDELRRSAYRALYEDSDLARYAVQAVPAIHIIVKNGNVALEGFVGSETDKNRAALRADSVPKAVSVKNNLVVVQAKGSSAE